jgi:hypothetical protein
MKSYASLFAQLSCLLQLQRRIIQWVGVDMPKPYLAKQSAHPEHFFSEKSAKGRKAFASVSEFTDWRYVAS